MNTAILNIFDTVGIKFEHVVQDNDKTFNIKPLLQNYFITVTQAVFTTIFLTYDIPED